MSSSVARYTKKIGPVLRRYLPIVAWLPAYKVADLKPDLVAGAISWAVMVPVAMAYAQMAGVPAEAGLYASIASLIAYTIFGTSRHQKVLASSTMAIMSAAVIAPLAGGDMAAYASLSAALALTVGVLLILAGFVKLGFISDFLSKSVVVGFVFGLAINIAVSQAPKLFGVPAGSGTTLQQFMQLLGNLAMTNPWTLAVSITSLAIVIFLRVRYRRIPAAPVVLVYGILIVALLNLDERGVSVVGAVPTGLPQFGWPSIGGSTEIYLVIGAIGIIFLAVGESLGTARAYAAKYDYNIDANQELVALGAANVSAGLFQGFTIDASLSQTATAEQAGGRTQLSSLVSAVLIILTVVFLAGIFQNLPNAVLAVVVMNSVISLMDVKELRRYYALRRTDFVIALAALAGVVLTDVLTGLVIAVVLSLIFIVYRASRPYIALLGRAPGSLTSFGDIVRHPEYEQIPGLMIVRLDAPLYFLNAGVAQTIIREMSAALPEPRALLIDLGASGDLDIPTMDLLADVDVKLRNRGVTLMFAQMRGAVRDRLERANFMDVIGAENIFPSLAAGVEAYQQRLLAAPSAESEAAPSADPDAAPEPEPGVDPNAEISAVKPEQ
ncbi:MAG: SulP family inorganic anion transporter [Caldilinea sp.]